MSKKKDTCVSLTSSAGSAGSASGLREPDLFGQSPSVNENPFAKPFSANTGPTRRSTTMSEPSTQMDLEELTSSSAASPASPGVRPGSKEAQKMTATSGRKWLALLKSYGLNISLARTCEDLLTREWASSAAFLTWKASDTAPSHLLFQLAPLMPRTDETASGLLHTPTAKANQMAPSMKERDLGSWWPTPRTTGLDGGSNSRKAAKARGMWPTPLARDSAGQWMSHERRETREPDTLGSWTHKYEGSGALNPTWVEWLMGFPTGWTDLEPSEMPSSRKSSRKSGGRSSQRSVGNE